jgi:hypothetical protein
VTPPPPRLPILLPAQGARELLRPVILMNRISMFSDGTSYFSCGKIRSLILFINITKPGKI